MNIRGIRRLEIAAQWARRKFVHGAVILLYHRITQIPSDPSLLAVSPQHFAEHLAILQKYFHPMSLQKLIKALHNKKIPPRAVAITFDDGYADNLYNAKPLLEQYDIPATVFVTTGYVDQSQEFLWDELDRLLLHTVSLPKTLNIAIAKQMLSWQLGAEANYGKNDYKRLLSWNITDSTNSDGSRQQLYRILWQSMRLLPVSERQKVLRKLQNWASIGSNGRTTHKVMTTNEVVKLTKGNLIEVGSHTVNHPALSSLPDIEQQVEIQQSQLVLEEILGHPIQSFSYPFGSRADYTQETIRYVKDAGFNIACSNFPDIVWHGTDPFQLPRVIVRDWTSDKFLNKLHSFLGN